MRTFKGLGHASLCLVFVGSCLAHGQVPIILNTYSMVSGLAESPPILPSVVPFTTRVTGTGSIQTSGSEFAGAGASGGMGGSYSAFVDSGNQFISCSAEATGEVVGSVFVYNSVASATAQLRYDFEIVGPSDVNVPVIVFTPDPSISGGSTGPAMQTGDAKLQIAAYGVYPGFPTNNYTNTFGSLEEKFYSTTGNPLTATSSDSFKSFEKFTVQANWNFNEVTMTTQTQVAGSAQDNPPNFTPIDSFMTVTLDPFVEIDPSFADASLYHIVFSPNVRNAVPEPASWASMAFGLFLVTRRRRRRVG